jgi:ribosome-associated protein
LLETKAIAKLAATAADVKNGADILVLDVDKLTTIADYFVICSGTSTPQIRAIADEIERILLGEEEIPVHVEGYFDANWILMDYGRVVVHIFRQETREFYSLEHLWADAPAYKLADLK